MKGKNGQPIEGAEIKIDDRRHYSHSHKYGDYWRILLPGTYTVTVHKDGYKTDTKKVEVDSDSATTVNFVLVPEETNSAAHNLSHLEPPARDATETNNPGILTTLVREHGNANQDQAYPLLSQIQKIDQQLMASSPQGSQPWQSDLQSLSSSSNLSPNSPFQPPSFDDFSLANPFDENGREFYMNGPKELQDTQQIMNELDLEKQDFFDNKTEFTGDEAKD